MVRSAVENLTESLRRWVWVVSRRQQATLASAFRDGRVMLLFAPTGCVEAAAPAYPVSPKMVLSEVCRPPSPVGVPPSCSSQGPTFQAR